MDSNHSANKVSSPIREKTRCDKSTQTEAACDKTTHAQPTRVDNSTQTQATKPLEFPSLPWVTMSPQTYQWIIGSKKRAPKITEDKGTNTPTSFPITRGLEEVLELHSKIKLPMPNKAPVTLLAPIFGPQLLFGINKKLPVYEAAIRRMTDGDRRYYDKDGIIYEDDSDEDY